jgi:hypothetical protein
MRSPVDMPGRHICICEKNSSKIKQCGFETIELNKDPGRLGACLRLVFAMLTQNVTYIRSGRPGWHVRIMEEYQKLDDTPIVNTVYCPCNGLAPFMDGFVMVNRPNVETIVQCITSQLVYGEVYGTDECNINWFNIEKQYITKNGMGYSNVNTMPQLNKYTQRVNFVEFDEKLLQWPFSILDAKNSMLDAAKYLPLSIAYDENMTNKNTREGTEITVSYSIKSMYEKLKATRRERKSMIFRGLNVLSNVKINQNTYQTYSCEIGINTKKTIYNHIGSKNCVLNTIKAIFNRRNLDWFETFAKSSHIPELVPESDLEGFLKLMQINFCIVKGNQGLLYEFNTRESIEFIELTYEQGVYMHVKLIDCNIGKRTKFVKSKVLINRNTKIESAGQQITIEEFLEWNEKLSRSESFHPEVTTQKINNLIARLNGRVDLIMERNNGFSNKSFSILSDKLVLIDQGNLDLNRIYIALTGNISKPTIIGKYLNKFIVYTYNSNLFSGVILNPGIKFFEKKILLKTILTKEKIKTIGFLNYESKDYSKKNNLLDMSVPIDPNANSIIIYEYDNRKHHNEDFFLTIKAKTINNMIMSNHWSDKMKLLLKERNMLKLVCSQSKIKLQWCVDLKIERYLNSLFDNELTKLQSDEKALENCIKNIDSCKWIKSNNIYVPNKVKYALFESELNGLIKRNQLTITILNTLLQKHYGFNISTTVDEVIEVNIDIYEGKLPTNLNNFGNYGDTKSIHLFESFKTITLHKKGTGLISNKVELQNQGEIIVSDEKAIGTPMKFDYKQANADNQTQVKIPEHTEKILHTVTALANEKFEDALTARYNESLIFDNKPLRWIGNGIPGSPITGEVYHEVTAPHVMNYWDDETGLLDTVIPLPNHNIGLKWKETFDDIVQTEKAKLTEYPGYSQPAYTKRYGAGISAVSDLYGGFIKLRQVEHDAKRDAKLFADTYFVRSPKDRINLNFNTDEIISWLRERPDTLKICTEIDEVLSSLLDVAGMEKVNVHMKLESRMKDVIMASLTGDIDMPGTITDQKVRLIMWQRKGITALFSPVFKRAKENLKDALRSDVVYVDGKTADEISAILKNVNEDCDLIEDDLSKQDRQTDATIINTEMEIYKLLGVDPSLVDVWRRIHGSNKNKWYAKGVGVTFLGEAMRHTGQATTALGNAIVNLLVKMRLVRKLGKNMRLMLVLGDDNIMLAKIGVVTTKMVSENSARHFNMQSKPKVSKRSGNFLRMTVYKNSFNCYECCPDFMRLSRRFEVTNGVSEANDENIIARCMSYLCMIGSNDVTEELWRELTDVESPLKIWYEYDSAINAVADYYKTNTMVIEGKLNHLFKMIKERKVVTFKKWILTTK